MNGLPNRYRDVKFNIAFVGDSLGIVGELQENFVPIHKNKKETHELYEIRRREDLWRGVKTGVCLFEALRGCACCSVCTCVVEREHSCVVGCWYQEHQFCITCGIGAQRIVGWNFRANNTKTQ